MSLNTFLKQTSIYEQTPVPFSPLLRRATWTGMALTAIGSLILMLLPMFVSYLSTLQFPLFLGIIHTYTHVYVDWLVESIWLRYVNGCCWGRTRPAFLTRNLRREGYSSNGWPLCRPLAAASIL